MFRQIPTHPDYKLGCSADINGALYRVISVSPAFTQAATPTLLADPKDAGAGAKALKIAQSPTDKDKKGGKGSKDAAAGGEGGDVKYAKYDEEGFPTHYEDGTEMTKNQYKKVRKLLEQEKKKAEKKAGKK